MMPLTRRPSILHHLLVASILAAGAVDPAEARDIRGQCARVRTAGAPEAWFLHNNDETARSESQFLRYEVGIRLAARRKLARVCSIESEGDLYVHLLLTEAGTDMPADAQEHINHPERERDEALGIRSIGTPGEPPSWVESLRVVHIPSKGPYQRRAGAPINFYDAFYHVRARHRSEGARLFLAPDGSTVGSSPSGAPYELDAHLILEWVPAATTGSNVRLEVSPTTGVDRERAAALNEAAAIIDELAPRWAKEEADETVAERAKARVTADLDSARKLEAAAIEAQELATANFRPPNATTLEPSDTMAPKGTNGEAPEASTPSPDAVSRTSEVTTAPEGAKSTTPAPTAQPPGGALTIAEVEAAKLVSNAHEIVRRAELQDYLLDAWQGYLSAVAAFDAEMAVISATSGEYAGMNTGADGVVRGADDSPATRAAQVLRAGEAGKRVDEASANVLAALAWLRANAQSVREVVYRQTGVPIRIDIKSVPPVEVSLVSHPGAVAVTHLTCRDLVGTNATTEDDPNAAVDDGYCAANPAGNVWMDSIYTAPLGLRVRLTPSPDLAALGFSTELSTVAIGDSGWFTDTVDPEQEPAPGVVTPFAAFAGADVQAEIGGTKMTFLLGGGAMLVDSVSGMRPRSFVGFNLSVPITTAKIASNSEKVTP